MKYTVTQNGTEQKAEKTAHIMKHETSWCKHDKKKQNKRIQEIYIS
jgi:hypothetical protein